MARAGTLVLLLLLRANLITSALLTDLSQIKVYPKHGSISGVFHVSLSDGYAFSASRAREVCEDLGVTIADKAQVVRASTQGFETCRFGWIDEQIAVIPRIQAKAACGKGQVGVIVWRALLTTKFDVFCFNAKDFEVHAQVPTTQAPHKKTTTGTVAPRTAQSSAGGVLQLVKTTASAPAVFWPDLRATFSGRSHAHSPILNYPEDTEQALALSSTKTTIGAVSTALLITTIFTFLLAAIVAVWYFKTGRSPPGTWDGEQQNECIETEEWDAKEAEAEAEEDKHHPENADDVSVRMHGENDENESRESE